MRVSSPLRLIVPHFLVLLLMACLAGGCGERVQPPIAISLEQIPTEIGKAFATASGEAKELSGMVVSAVQSKDFSKAAMSLEALARRPDLSKLQARTVAGASLTVNSALVEAASKGDTQATETLNVRRLTK